MAKLRFRKRIKILPGVHINVSRTGVSANAGVKGASVTVGAKGTHANAGLPGTGISMRQKLSGSTRVPPLPQEAVAPAQPSQLGWVIAIAILLGVGILIGMNI